MIVNYSKSLSDDRIREAVKEYFSHHRGEENLTKDFNKVRMAYSWLDAQRRAKGLTQTYLPLKHMIEAWANFYIPAQAVCIAVNLHPDFFGKKYPHFNLKKDRIIRPDRKRLEGIPGVGSHNYSEKWNANYYHSAEQFY